MRWVFEVCETFLLLLSCCFCCTFLFLGDNSSSGAQAARHSAGSKAGRGRRSGEGEPGRRSTGNRKGGRGGRGDDDDEVVQRARPSRRGVSQGRDRDGAGGGGRVPDVDMHGVARPEVLEDVGGLERVVADD